MEANPFPEAVIADWSFLEHSDSRSHCPKCRKSRKYYCYTCFIPLPHLAEHLPHIKVVLVFPCEDSLTLEEISKASSNSLKKQELNVNLETTEKVVCHNSLDSGENGNVSINLKVSEAKTIHIGSDREEETEQTKGENKLTDAKSLPFERVVFIDSTWNQTNNIVTDERLKNLKKIELSSHNTQFWRCQDGIPRTYLSTIEAIYYFLVDFHRLFINPEYNHEYDNMLFFFCAMYEKIRSSLNSKSGKRLKAYER
ncbi:tRNA-uridine aminocarboxypropyltransferase 1-like isoform X2 [Biomphalaria glabrata]|uniref:tRNA-uridine aminocarboxypropyltransferase 1 n=1 Tax=Biomphalaria glabrata TaxID=6526 RepID=A0A9W2ZJE4_BIOGL|nr:tRNA-uridine aminocarboxypropyltransferase 1-like isoform X2 [Biomphalaria glabrata]